MSDTVTLEVPTRHLPRVRTLLTSLLSEEAKEARVAERMKKLEQIWKDSFSYIQRRIEAEQARDNPGHSGFDARFRWEQLLWQELWMWVRLDNPVTRTEHGLMCDRRAFNEQQRAFTLDVLRKLDLLAVV